MFSSRFKWGLETNRLAKLIEEKRRDGVRLLDLTESNPTRAGFDYPEDFILESLASPQAMLYEPAPRGLPAARRSISDYYRGRGFDLDPDRIHLTASTSEAYSYLFKLLADQGENILVPAPSYPLFDFLASLEGVELSPYELEYTHPAGWRINFDSIEKALTEKTRAIILVNPNNPTGSFIKKAELARLNEACSRSGAALIADEVFSDYEFDRDDGRRRSLVDNAQVLTFVMSGFSKILALPQMKLGWIITNGPERLRDEAIDRLDLIADTFLSVSTPVQHAAAGLLTLRRQIQEQVASRVATNLKLLAAKTEGSSCRLLKVEGGWYATLEIPRHFSEEDWALKLLEEDDLLIHPGYFFDFPREAYLILSLLPEPDLFNTAVEKLFNRVK